MGSLVVRNGTTGRRDIVVAFVRDVVNVNEPLSYVFHSTLGPRSLNECHGAAGQQASSELESLALSVLAPYR